MDQKQTEAKYQLTKPYEEGPDFAYGLQEGFPVLAINLDGKSLGRVDIVADGRLIISMRPENVKKVLYVALGEYRKTNAFGMDFYECPACGFGEVYPPSLEKHTCPKCGAEMRAVTGV